MFFSLGSIKTYNSCKMEKLVEYSDVIENNVYENHHVMKEATILIEKLSFKEVYLILISSTVKKSILKPLTQSSSAKIAE